MKRGDSKMPGNQKNSILTWGEFKRAVESHGITDGVQISFIDTKNDPTEVEVVKDKDGHLVVSGKRPTILDEVMKT
jgi:hypothetical protein